MDSAADMHDRHARGLAELAELGLAVARDLRRRQMEAETDEDAAKLAVAFHHVSRTVRQTYALEARLHRDAERDIRETAERVEKAEANAHRDRISKHWTRVHDRVDRLIWTEHEDDEAEELVDTLYGLLCEARADDDFLDTPVEVLVERLSQDLGLKAQVPPPQGEGDPKDRPRADPSKQRGAVEGVEAHSDLSRHSSTTASPFNPLSRHSPTAPPEAEQLGAAGAPPPPPLRRPPYGLPGEFGPNGETGEDRIPDRWMI